MNNLIGQVEQSIHEHRLFRRREKILVAVSGGLDSMVLLHVLHQLAPSHGWSLAVGHFNHLLRGRESALDLQFVRRVAEKWGLKFAEGHGNAANAARKDGVSIEMAARRLRHGFLARVAKRHGARTVALAHHADDQVELFFIRLLRGASLEGLGGMNWKSPSPADAQVELARPLLGVEKEELRQYAADQHIAFREDSTNHRLDVPRNRIRNQLLPLLRRHYQPALRQVILRLMRQMDDTAGFVAAASRDHPQRGEFSKLAPAIQRWRLSKQLTALGIEVDFERLETLRLRANAPVMVEPEIVVLRDAQGRIIRRPLTNPAFNATEEVVNLNGLRGTISLDAVSIRWRKRKSAGLPARQALREYFDADQIGSGVILRYWRAGDRFQPVGMTASVKLQDWFVNRKVPRQDRHRLIIATTQRGEIFWVEGQRIGERFKIRPQTQTQLRWEWERKDPVPP